MTKKGERLTYYTVLGLGTGVLSLLSCAGYRTVISPSCISRKKVCGMRNRGGAHGTVEFEATRYVKIELMHVVCVRIELERELNSSLLKGAATILLRGECEY